jgi:hypothetical protein
MTMFYTKPEVVAVGDPNRVIQITIKVGVHEDNALDPTGCSAYEADE